MTEIVSEVTKFVSEVTKFVSEVTKLVSKFVSEVTKSVSEVTKSVSEVTKFVSSFSVLGEFWPGGGVTSGSPVHRNTPIFIVFPMFFQCFSCWLASFTPLSRG